MPCTAVLALILVASLPASSAVTPGLRGSKTEGSAAHTDALRPDDVTPGLFFVRGSKTEGPAAHTDALSPDDVNCTDMDIAVQNFRKWKSRANEFVKIMPYVRQDAADDDAATRVANSILKNVVKLGLETAALIAKFDQCPAIKKALEKNIDRIHLFEGHLIAVQNLRKLKDLASEFVKLMKDVREDAAGYGVAKVAATPVANSILANLLKLWQETAVLRAKFDPCPDIKKALQKNIDGIHELEGQIMEYVREDAAGYGLAKVAATPVANSILANVVKRGQETAALIAKHLKKFGAKP